MYAQAEATKTMAAAMMMKATLLEDQNIVMLKTLPDSQVSAEALGANGNTIKQKY